METNHAEQNAAAWVESMAELVTALQCDYARLEELRGTRDALREEFDANPANNGVDFDNWVRNQVGFSTEEADELRELTEAATIEGEVQTDADAVRERIQESVLAVEVRGDWYTPGESQDDDTRSPAEFQILLSTGGPALRIMGELNEYGEPSHAWLETNDWGTPWVQYFKVSRETLLAFCQCFYFGE
jgi:hypothetical protein